MQFKVQDEPGTLRIWQREFENLRLPYLFNLKTDPYERATITSNTYWNWYIRHVFLLVPAQEKVANFLSTFKEFPPRQKGRELHRRPGPADPSEGARRVNLLYVVCHRSLP